MARRIALLYSGHQYHARVAELAHALGEEMIVIDLVSGPKFRMGQVSDCDLILYEAFGPMEQYSDALTRIRRTSRAPIVMLTVGSRRDRMIDALRAGADAVIPLHASRAVFVAHCAALMRRWRTAKDIMAVETNSAF